jgi:hypothetical protein
MTANTQQPTGGLRLLDPFAGKWHTTGLIPETPEHPAMTVTGTDTYAWLPGGHFLLHTVDVMVGDEKTETTEIIGFEAEQNRYPMRYFDNKGNTGLMYASFNNGTWTFQGDTLRFTGSFNEDQQTISGIWEQSADGQQWSHFMDIKLTRQLLQ